MQSPSNAHPEDSEAETPQITGCCPSFQRSPKPKDRGIPSASDKDTPPASDRGFLSPWNKTANRQDQGEGQGKMTANPVVTAIQGNEWLKEVLRKAKEPDSKLVVLEFTAPWSEPCKFMKPALEETASRFKAQADFYTLDVEQFKTFARNTRVEALPTFLLVRKTILERVVGVSKDELQRSIQKHLPSTSRSILISDQ